MTREREVGAAPAQRTIEYFVNASEIARMLSLDHTNRCPADGWNEGAIPAYQLGEVCAKPGAFSPSEIHRVDAAQGKLRGPSVSLRSGETQLSKTQVVGEEASDASGGRWVRMSGCSGGGGCQVDGSRK